MKESALPSCIEAINTYHHAHPHPLVVCSRSSEYAAASQSKQLTLQRAVVIQPLNSNHIEMTLVGGGKRLSGLYAAYKTNMALQELAVSPLLLYLLVLTYQGTPASNLLTKGTALQKQVFEQYVTRMMTRKGRYPSVQTLHWLAFLAHRMRTHNQTIFSIKGLRPKDDYIINWLTQRIGTYHCMVQLIATPFIMIAAGIFALPYGLIIPLCFVPLIALAYWLLQWLNLWPNRYLVWLVGVPVGVLGLMLIARLCWLLAKTLTELFARIINAPIDMCIWRICLWLAGVLPFRLTTFLKDAQARHLLKCVGGTYQFMHRLLLDYFADVDPARRKFTFWD